MNEIYKITNKVNGKCYIGLTTQSTKQRWSEHKSRFTLGERDHKLYRAMRKYGIKNFICETICTVFDRDDLPKLEIYFIEKFNSFKRGYNMNCGGDFVSEDTKEKIRQKMLGRKITWDNGWEKRRNNPDALKNWEYALRGAAHQWSKRYLVKHPDGLVEIVHGLNEFCRIHNLFWSAMRRTLTGEQKAHKGYVLLARLNDHPEREYTQASGSGAALESHQEQDMIWSAQ